MVHLCFSMFVLVTFQTLVNCAPTTDITSAAGYLSRYGYLTQRSNALTSQETLTTALRNFQAFAGLNVTGELDNQTLKLMSTPRCGVMDVDALDRNDSHVRTKRYEIHGSRWRIRNITYHISKYPRRLSRGKVDRAISRALEMWSNHTDLKFTRWPGDKSRVHIDIRFERGEHGDWDEFDGPDGTLAHAFFPRYGGAVHFDDDESWTVGNDQSGPNLFQIAVHELGHSLGLHHSENSQAIMGPYYKEYSSNFSLHEDDIDGITHLYGPSPILWAPEPRRAPSMTSNSLCADLGVDAMFTDKDGVISVLKGDLYYRLSESGVAPGYPSRISDNWVGLPGNIDAAFTYRNGKTFFFKGSQYWRFTGTSMDESYPKNIADGFTGIPNYVDAVIEWTGNGRVYFFKGDKFWMFDPSRRPSVSPRYPKMLSNWQGIPNNVDAALTYHEYTYFFKDDRYYRFHDEYFRVDDGEPPFPRSTSDWWFGCRKKSHPNMVTD